MKSFEEILETSKDELARWLVNDPRVFAERVITITDDGEMVRLFSNTLEQAGEIMRKHGVELSEQIRDRMTSSESPVVIVRIDGAVGLETFRWGWVLAAVGDGDKAS